MKMTKRKKPNLQKKRDTQSDNIIKKVMIAPLIFVITILPLVMRIKTYNPNLSQFSWYPDIDLTTDVFLYFWHGKPRLSLHLSTDFFLTTD